MVPELIADSLSRFDNCNLLEAGVSENFLHQMKIPWKLSENLQGISCGICRKYKLVDCPNWNLNCRHLGCFGSIEDRVGLLDL